MDFHQLIARMQELDRPATEAAPVSTEECGMMPPASPMSTPSEPPIPHPSLSVNLNAQGMDNIEQIMKLITKVNPDAVPQQPPMPTMAPPPSIMSIKPELPPLKMLPDFDADNDDMPGGEKDMPEPKDIMIKMGDEKDNDKGSQPGGLGASLDRDGDGDHDMDDHDIEPKDDDDKKKEAWANEPDESEASIDYMNNKLAGGMNKPKDTFPKVADGDNPMQKVREDDSDLRAQIRADLRRRLAEAKGAK
jgi:hypothetical protein